MEATVTGVSLSLEPLAVPGGHDDLELTLGEFRHVCDSYYLRLDPVLIAGTDIFGVLARLLDRWIEQLQRLRRHPGHTLLLFDLSDHRTGWLRVTADNTTPAVIEAGWSEIEGYAFHPSDFAETASTINDFTPIDGATLTCHLDDLITTLTENRTELASASELPIHNS
jgi:hypothetical protein